MLIADTVKTFINLLIWSIWNMTMKALRDTTQLRKLVE